MRFSRRTPATGQSSLCAERGGNTLHQTALAPCCGVLVDDALGRSSIDSLDGFTGYLSGVLGARLGRRKGALCAGLHLRADCLVAQAGLLALTVALNLALDVRHGTPSG